MPFAAAPSGGAPIGNQLSGRHSQLFMVAHNALINVKTAHLPTTMHVLTL